MVASRPFEGNSPSIRRAPKPRNRSRYIVCVCLLLLPSAALHRNRNAARSLAPAQPRVEPVLAAALQPGYISSEAGLRPADDNRSNFLSSSSIVNPDAITSKYRKTDRAAPEHSAMPHRSA